MDIKSELKSDFSINLPRVLISGNVGIIDNVKGIVFVSESSVVVFNGKRYTSVSGNNLIINEIEDERVQISGDIRAIEFFGTLS
ncbi:MAG: YabP/YqfC family sporulation protein [Anaerovoracaceae bacterium]